MGIASLILGILAIILCFTPIPGVIAIICAVVGIILGVLARKNPEQRGLGTAGMIVSIIALAIVIIVIIAAVVCVSAAIGALSSLAG